MSCHVFFFFFKWASINISFNYYEAKRELVFAHEKIKQKKHKKTQKNTKKHKKKYKNTKTKQNHNPPSIVIFFPPQ